MSHLIPVEVPLVFTEKEEKNIPKNREYGNYSVMLHKKTGGEIVCYWIDDPGDETYNGYSRKGGSHRCYMFSYAHAKTFIADIKAGHHQHLNPKGKYSIVKPGYFIVGDILQDQ